VLITIGITTYDRISLLEDTIHSVLNQTFSDFKIILANDNPKRTLSFENLAIPADSRIEIVNHKVNLGEIENLNWLMNNASTPYFTWLADDDLLHPKYLEVLLAELQSASNCKAAYSNYISSEYPPNDFYTSSIVGDFESLSTQEFLLRYSDRSLSLIGCYGLFELEQLKRMGGFRSLGTGYSPGGDTLIPILLSSYTKINYIDVALVFFRSHPGSMSIAANNLSSFTTADFDFIAYGKNSIDLCSPDARKIVFINFRKWFQDNHLTVAKRQAGSNMFKMAHLFWQSERSNYLLFRPYNLGTLRNMSFYIGIILLIFESFGKAYLLPKTRRKIRNYFK
jgi:glycosyltransferase involved in cell wall biosynthesis